MNSKYFFTTSRLGARKWLPSDFNIYSVMNQDKDVMEHFPALQSSEQSNNFMKKQNIQIDEYGFGFFAIDLLETNEFIGFVGLNNVSFESDFTPCVEIGWRLKKQVWGKGYATETAQGCLNFGFEKCNLNAIYSFAVLANKPSENVMQKIGMKKLGEFDHPMLLDFPEMKKCVLYKIEKIE